MTIKYNTDNLLIEYHNNTEYRTVLRSLFNMKSNHNNIKSQYETIDTETLFYAKNWLLKTLIIRDNTGNLREV